MDVVVVGASGCRENQFSVSLRCTSPTSFALAPENVIICHSTSVILGHVKNRVSLPDIKNHQPRTNIVALNNNNNLIVLMNYWII